MQLFEFSNLFNLHYDSKIIHISKYKMNDFIFEVKEISQNFIRPIWFCDMNMLVFFIFLNKLFLSK